MAKVDTLKLNIDGKDYSYNINVGVEGIFRCHLDWAVAEKLGVKPSKVEAKTLSEVKSTIMKPLSDYIKATKKESTWIWLVYKSSYPFNQDSNGRSMFDNFSQFSNRSFTGDPSTLVFDFGVNIKVENSTGTEEWYEARKGCGSVNHGEGDLNDKDTWYKDRTTYKQHDIMIPYSAEAYKTLESAREGLRGISEILFNFISQDLKLIAASLTQGNLLNAPKPKIDE